ncbi:aspartate-semialdehyde dehydrogenase [Chondromyces apiculatus]|uniref:Aspartate-semialdehyde dehydrogenase n=1 Tax=Chondromyces apiculatus DSM 436 TaxID=1192034 RepID=A0A017T9G5_9BACT|nr:aspartate-semialdehyde dehydrogenase [Chondromyces apiculatus]EYF05460.1 Aspartate-semialdehyde dehydrogenase [Chondromyces apiculatus DSM 436]
MSRSALRIAVVGATGAVGETLLALFSERQLAFDALSLVASARSAGRTIVARGETYQVEALERFDFSGIDLAFFSAGSAVSLQWARAAAKQGALVIDNTSAFRMDPRTPLVVPQVNGDLLRRRPEDGIVANPNCATIPVVRALAPLDRRYGVRKIVVSTYQAASGAGLTGMEELRSGARASLSEERVEPSSGRFKVPLAFNVVPSIDVMQGSGFTLEEQKIVQESRKILGRDDLLVSATAVRVPVFNGHSEAVYFECEAPLDRAEIVEILRGAPEIVVHDGEGAAGFPTPRFLPDPDRVHVGRIRVVPDNPHAGWLWLVTDNLRIGAALNALQIAEMAIAHDLL